MHAARPEPLQPRPWYREPWPWILMSGPASVIVAGVFTMALAFRTEDGLVADDYYKQGLAINQVLRRSERARELNLEAVVSFSGSRVRVVLQGDEAPPGLRLRWVHPARAGHDQSVVLHAAARGVYEGNFTPSGGETRRLVLEDTGANWRLTGTWNGRAEALRLAAR
jgi:hypothetical protein